MNALLECPDCVESWEVEEEEKSDPVRDVLIKAKTLIEQRGWCQKEQISMTGAYCIVGAIRYHKFFPELFLDSFLHHDASVRFWKANGLFCPVTQWNDDIHRTKQEVLDAFDKAIAWREDS